MTEKQKDIIYDVIAKTYMRTLIDELDGMEYCSDCGNYWEDCICEN